MASPPSVSIGFPVFNGARYLREAIEDFLGQTYSDFELIVSDNASTDETEDIVREAAKRDARIRYVRNETNIGALPNANRTFERARGRYYCLAAHDDRHAPRFLERLVTSLERKPSAVLAYGRSMLIDEMGASLRAVPERGLHVIPDGRAVDYDQSLERSLPTNAAKRYQAVLQSNDINAPIHGLFRRAVLERVGGHQFHGSDRLIVAHAAMLGSFAFVDEPLFSYRIHPESTFFLTRDAWAQRETGKEDLGSPFSTFRTLNNYLRAVSESSLSGVERVRAYTATFGYAIRPTALRNTFLPGLDNYLGWRRWPWQREVKVRLMAPSAAANPTPGIPA